MGYVPGKVPGEESMYNTWLNHQMLMGLPKGNALHQGPSLRFKSSGMQCMGDY